MRVVLILAASFALTVPAFALDTSVQVVLDLKGNAQRDIKTYACDGIEPFQVDYINAAPIFLAFLPVAGEKLVFVNVLAEKGARYAAGQWEWTTNGTDGVLTDLSAEKGTAPLTCVEQTETP